MDNTPYEKWGGFVLDRLRRAGIEDGILLDLGCGTGNMTELLADAGYDMIGVDLSEEMLNVAMEKRACSGHEILYLAQDMREFELYGTVRAVVCFCDSLNYLLEEEELAQCFRLVNNYLDPGGLFIFDFNTVYKDVYKRQPLRFHRSCRPCSGCRRFSWRDRFSGRPLRRRECRGPSGGNAPR